MLCGPCPTCTLPSLNLIVFVVSDPTFVKHCSFLTCATFLYIGTLKDDAVFKSFFQTVLNDKSKVRSLTIPCEEINTCSEVNNR